MNIPDFEYTNVLFVGVGGGFDIFGSIPLAASMTGYGDRKGFDVREAEGEDFPSSSFDRKCYVLGRNGVQLVKDGIQKILNKNPDIDTIIGIDGGIDSKKHRNDSRRFHCDGSDIQTVTEINDE